MAPTSRRREVMHAISDQRVVAVIRERDRDAAIEAARLLFHGGLRVVEISLTTPGATSAIESLAAENPGDWILGAGTVLDETSARLAIGAGARFLVSPTLQPPVCATAHRYGLVAIPGVATPTEALAAAELGCDAVKWFPASAITPSVLAAVLQALPQLAVVPTGGVDIRDVPAWLGAGAVAVGVGSALVGPDAATTNGRVRDLLDAVGASTAGREPEQEPVVGRPAPSESSDSAS